MWDADVRAAFSRLLRAGDGGAASLEALDRLGMLAAFLPGWADVRCRPQRDPYHHLTVDAHLTGSLRAMGRLLAGEGAGDDGCRPRPSGKYPIRSAPPRGAPARHRQERGGWARAGRRACRRVDPRPDGHRAPGPRPRPLPGGSASAPSGHRDPPGSSDENLVLDVAAAVGSPIASPRSICSPRPTPRRPVPPRGRHGDGRSSTSSSRRSSTSWSAARWGPRSRNSSPTGSSGCAGRRARGGGRALPPADAAGLPPRRRPRQGGSALRDGRAYRRRQGCPGRPPRWDATRHV